MSSFLLLWRYLKTVGPYRPLIKIAVILMIIWTIINFLPPWIIMVLIDDALPRQDLTLLNILVIMQLFIICNNQFMGAVKGFIYTYLQQNVNLDLNLKLFDHVMTLPVQFFNSNDTGSLVHRFMQDVTQTRELTATILIDVMVHLATLLMLLGVLFYINVKLALICLGIAAIYAVNVNIFKNRIYGAAKDIGERTGELYALLYQIIPGVREVKSLQLSKYVQKLYASGLIKFFRANVTNYRLGVYVGLIAEILRPLAWAIIIAVGGREVIKGSLSIGSLLAFANYLDRIYGPINGLSGLYSEIQRVVPAMERVATVLDTKSEFNTFKGQRLLMNDVKGHIVLKAVGFGYLKDKPVEKNINMDINPGSKVAIVGPSGCGKSTLAHLILRFYDVSSGSIYLDGINIKQINLPNYRRQVGLIPQGIKLFSASIKDNILMGDRHAPMERVIDAAKAAHAHEFIMDLPEGYETLYGEKGVFLSGGESQRVVIARSVLQNPRVLILDEATSSVDANSEALIQDSINKLSSNRTTIVIAHRFSTIIDANWIYVMDRGMIIAEGTHQTLLKDSSLYASLYQKQIRENILEEFSYAT